MTPLIPQGQETTIALLIKFNEVDAQSQSLRIFTIISEPCKSLRVIGLNIHKVRNI